MFWDTEKKEMAMRYMTDLGRLGFFFCRRNGIVPGFTILKEGRQSGAGVSKAPARGLPAVGNRWYQMDLGMTVKWFANGGVRLIDSMVRYLEMRKTV
jgi:hypothetical protein